MRDRSKQEMLKDMRARLSLLPGMNVTVGQPISHRIDHMLSGTRANIAVKICGDDLGVLRSMAKQDQAAMSGVRGVVDVAVDQQTEVPTVRVKTDPAIAARY